MRTIFNKHKYIRVVCYNENKSCTVSYHLDKDYKPSYLINPDHVFLFNGYRTHTITDKSAETINPLDFQSKYNPKDFQTAIESKLIRETFSTLDKNKFDLTTMLLIGCLIGIVGIIYLILKGNGSL